MSGKAEKTEDLLVEYVLKPQIHDTLNCEKSRRYIYSATCKSMIYDSFELLVDFFSNV